MKKRMRETRYWMWIAGLLPFVYTIVFFSPRPFGLGLRLGADFTVHRLGWLHTETYFVSHGHVPLWNPSDMMGKPYLALRGTGFYYPPRWVTYLPTFAGGIVSTTTQFIVLAAHMSVAMLGMYLILRRVCGCEASVSALGASPLLLNQVFNNMMRYPYAVENMAWIPWVLYFAVRLARLPRVNSQRAVATTALSLAIVTALSWLTGYGHYSHSGLMICGIIALGFARSIRGMAAAASAVVVGTGVACGSIVPAVLELRHNPLRNGSNILASAGYCPGASYLSMLVDPFAIDVGRSGFVFPVFVLLAVIGIIAMWLRGQRRTCSVLLLALLIVLDLGRGLHGVLYAVCYHYVPGFAAFRGPAKLLWLALLPLGIFIGHGAEYVRQKSRRAWACAAAAIILATVLILLHPVTIAGQLDQWVPLNNWNISKHTSVTCYYLLVLVSSAAVAGFFAVSARAWRTAMLATLCVVFVVCYARYNCFAGEGEYGRPAGVRSMFSQGLLGPYKPGSRLLEYSVDHCTAPEEFAALLTNSACLAFPDTRFRWTPDDMVGSAAVTLHEFGPNHLDFSVDAESDGTLLYLANYHKDWRCTHKLQPDARVPELMALPVSRGSMRVRMAFIPVVSIVTGAATLMLLFLLYALYSWSRRSISMARTCAAASMTAVAVYCAGAFNRHSLLEHAANTHDRNSVGKRLPLCNLEGTKLEKAIVTSLLDLLRAASAAAKPITHGLVFPKPPTVAEIRHTLVAAVPVGRATAHHTTNHVTIDLANLPTGSSPRVIAVRAQFTHAAPAPIFSYGRFNHAELCNLHVNSATTFTFWGYYADAYSACQPLTQQTICCSLQYDGTTAAIWVDGTRVAERALALQTYFSSLRIGGPDFPGHIRDVFVWNSAITNKLPFLMGTASWPGVHNMAFAQMPTGSQARTLLVRAVCHQPAVTFLSYGTYHHGALCEFGTNAERQLRLWGYYADLTSEWSMATNVLTDCALVYDGANARLYANGTMVATAALPLNTALTPCTIGCPAARASINGIWIWKRALTSEELRCIASTLD